MVRTVDYASRRRAILEATINRHIQQALPVASEDIAGDFDLSSATIRSIFAELEESGFLTHPYTSGGKIPTEKGYRYYVDFLISQMALLDEQREQIVREYRRQIWRLEDALEQTTEIISALTHYAGIVSFLDQQDKIFYKGISRILDQPEFQSVGEIRLLIKIIEDKQYLLDIINRDSSEKVKVYIGGELGLPEMQNFSLIVSTFNLRERPLGRLAVLGPMRMEYKQIIPTLEYISSVLSEVLDGLK